MENPNYWVIIKINSPSPHYRVFASWSGSYLGGASWRMNSGIKCVDVEGDYFNFYGRSGSLYKCHKNAYGIHWYGESILNNMIEESKKQGITIEVLPDVTDFAALDFYRLSIFCYNSEKELTL